MKKFLYKRFKKNLIKNKSTAIYCFMSDLLWLSHSTSNFTVNDTTQPDSSFGSDVTPITGVAHTEVNLAHITAPGRPVNISYLKNSLLSNVREPNL
jgi:hypothetical protein